MAWLCSEGQLSEVLLILTWWQPEACFLRSGDNLWEPRTPIPHVGCGATREKCTHPIWTAQCLVTKRGPPQNTFQTKKQDTDSVAGAVENTEPKPKHNLGALQEASEMPALCCCRVSPPSQLRCPLSPQGPAACPPEQLGAHRAHVCSRAAFLSSESSGESPFRPRLSAPNPPASGAAI